MRIRKQQSGFAVAELVLVVVILVAVVLAGWWVYQNQHKTTDTNTTATNQTQATSTQSPVANNVSKAPEVNSASDLDKALSTLNQNDPAGANSADSSQLDSQSSF